MIDAIGSGGAMSPSPPRNSNTPLSEQQQTVLAETLSGYDTDNISQEDAATIDETLKAAGINPGRELASAMAELGFDARAIGDLAEVARGGNKPPPPPQQSSEQVSEMVSYLAELVNDKLASSDQSLLSDDDKQAIYQQALNKFGIGENGSLINTSA